jgi:hypothetical protein
MNKDDRKRFNRVKNLHRKIVKEAELLPLKALEFKTGTLAVSEAILKTIDEKKFVTNYQVQAFENILTGIKAWTKRRKKK